ncbi:hypothetical protein [Amycolatopsis thailandensis]|uniref:WXG100-like domain-containing protein n=1 Tax=Amycolatopsis thailandensis TaxID=589330 RepID=UPI001178150D|nr:hypothetical protein [Amycolatopsis thailandensis]
MEFTLGLSWPESDDQGLVALWKAWEAFEDAAGVYEAAARAAGTQVPHVLEGETGEFFAHCLNTTIPDGVAGLGEAAGELAKMAQNAAADVYKTKVMFVVFAAFTLASIIHLMATLIGALFTGVVIAAARVALTAIWRALITRLGQLSLSGGLSHATKTALLKFAKDLAIKTGGFAAFGAALMGGTDFGVQARQIADGDRQGWDTKSLTSSLVGGALGGAFAGIFHSAAGGIRTTTFSLRDRLATRHPDDLLADNVTVGQVVTTIDKPLAALGDLAYATGQMITVVATAPLINLALGAPVGNPALGALGALSRYGGSRTTGTTSGTLDTIHPPHIPDLTIPQVEKPEDAEKPSSTEKAETTEQPGPGNTKTHESPPSYTPAAGQSDLRQDKTPAYTTSPHALGTLHTTAAAYGGSGVTVTTTSPQSDANPHAPLVADTTPAPGNKGTSTPDTLAPKVERGSPTDTASAPPGHRFLTPDTAVGSETRPDTSNRTRSTSPHTTSSRVQADRAAAPLSTTAGLSPALPTARPDTTGGHLAATARADGTALPDSTQSILTETAPATTRPPAMPDTLHVPALTDLAPSPPESEPSAITTARPHDVPTSLPIEPVRAIPLPGNGGVAFVPDSYTTNITNAFPHPEPGVFRVIAQHRDNTFALPGHHTLDPAHQPARLIAALQDLPTQLVAWSKHTKIDLLACDLTPALLDHLTPAIHATFGVELHAPYLHTPLFVAPTGGISLTDPGIPHTLHLAPKRRWGGTMAADPEDPQTAARLAETTANILHQYGDISTQWLSYSIPHEIFPQKKFAKLARDQFRQERNKQAASGTLWSPHYRGKRNYESYNKDELNDLTAWLYQKVIAGPASSPHAIAKTAATAGFATGYSHLVDAARDAIDAAMLDGRRHANLTLANPEHRDKIIALIDRIIVNTSDRTQVQTLASLNDLNVHGHSNLLRALITERQQALADDPALSEAARQLGLPIVRPSGAFLGRFLDVANEADRSWIDSLAYAATWEHKTATADELTHLLLDEGITGDPGVLREIVTTVIGEATLQGDRLPVLDAADQGQHAAIHARTGAIVNVTPALYASADPVTVLVTHMRTRHITGSQDDLETIARTIFETPVEKLTPDYSLAPLDLDELPSAARAIGVEGEPTGYGPDTSPAEAALATTAKQLLLEFGDLNIRCLVTRWPDPSGKSKPSVKEMSDHLTAERASLRASGELWLPTYRGLLNSGKDGHADDLSAWLYRKVVLDPTKGPTAIASIAEATGFTTGTKQLLEAARAAMEAATNDGRRHMHLTITKPEHRDRGIALLDRILANSSSLTQKQIAASLIEFNAHGEESAVRALASERQQALADDPALAEAARQHGLPTLQPTGTYHGRFLDVANEADQNWIGSLAYAAAWERKTDTIQQLVTLLIQEGIRDTNGALTPLVTRILAEADTHGDRYTTLSTHRPADHNAILRRTGSLVLKNHHELFTRDPAQATTHLVRHMRRNHITGPQNTLRDIAHTVYTLPTHQPLPGTHTIPIPTHDGLIVNAIPLPGNGGVAFVPTTYATNVLNAFPHPRPGVFTLVVHHRNDLFLLPGEGVRPVPHQAAQLVETLGHLPSRLAGWHNYREIELFACDLPAGHTGRLAAIARAALGVELTSAHPGRFVSITRGGDIVATVERPTGLPPGTLTLGGKRGQSTYSESSVKHPRIDEDPNHGLSPEQAESLRSAATEQVVTRLIEEGLLGDPAALTEVVVQAAAEAARRRAPAPPLPFVDEVLRRRSGEILLSDPELRDPDNPDRMTGLVRAPGERQVTTPEDVLRDHAQTMLAIRPDVPPAGSLSIPVTSPTGIPVRAMPFAGGVAFVSEAFTQNIFNAFPEPNTGTLRVVVPREHHRGGAFLLPGFLTSVEVGHDPDQFAEVLAKLPASIAAWASTGTIELFSCRVTPESGTNLTRLIRRRTGWRHLDLTVAHPNKPVAFTPTGGRRLADNGNHPAGTLILGSEAASVSAVRGEIDGSIYYRYIDSGGVVRAVAFWHKEQAETLAQTMQGRDLAAQLGHPGARVIFTHHVRDRFLISREEDRLRRASATIMFRIFDALVQDGVLPWRQENLLLASCEVSQAEADQFRELARDHGYTGDLRVITDQIVEIDPDAGASLLPPKARGANSGNDQTPEGGGAGGRAIRFGFVEENEAESSAVSRDTAVPALPAPAAPLAEVASLKPEADGALLDRATLPTMSRLAGLPLETLAGVLERFRVDNAPGLAPASHLNAWVEAQFSSRSTGNRSLPLSEVAGRTGGLVTGREIAEILARKVVDAHGSLTPAAVRLQLNTEGIRHPELNTAITEALARAEAEGSAWRPAYRGDRRPGVFAPDEPGPATLLLWRLAVDHPRDTAAGLAHRAEQAGLLGGEDLVRNAELAVDSAVHDQRRVLSAARPSDHPRIHSLIDALLVSEPGLDTPALVDRLRGHSVQEGLRGLHQLVEARLGLPAMDPEAARALLAPRPAGAILGRVLDSADAGNREIIGHLAYATAWTHKTDTVEQLATRLRRDGVTGPEPDLLRVITEAVAEADLHGDRLESLPADRPAYHHLLRLRVEQILADKPSLRDSRNPERLTQLVRQMRLHKVTGPQYLLTAHAHSALTRPATTPLGSGGTTVGAGFPAPTPTPRATPTARYQHLIDADGTVTGVGFLPETEASTLHAAAARHDLATQLGHPGARLVFAHHDHTGYTVPDPTDASGLFDALDITLAGLGATWKHQDILLVTCLPDPTHTEQFRATARARGYRGAIHATTSPHTEITEHHGARPLHPGDTPHENAVILNPTSQTVTFAKGVRDLMAGDWFNADHPAQRVIQLGESLYDGLLNAYESRGELPEIEVHGYGNSRRPGRAMATSVARADSVVVALLFGLNVAHQNRPAADRLPDFDLVPQAMTKITHGRAGSPLSSGRDLEERRRGVFVRIPAFPLPAGRVPTFTYRNPSGMDISWMEPLRFGSRFDPIRVPRDFLVPPGPALALESPTGAMIFPNCLVAMRSEWSRIRRYQGVISLWLRVNHHTGEVLLRGGLTMPYRDFATWVHEMLNGAPDAQRLLLLTSHGGEQPRRTESQPGVPGASLGGILSSITHGRVLTTLTGTTWTYGGELHANRWGLFHDGALLEVYDRPRTGNYEGSAVHYAVAAARLEYPRHAETAQSVDRLTAAAAADAYINPPPPPPPLPSASKPVKLPARTRIKFSPDSPRIELRYRNELERLFRQVYLHAQEAYDEAETFPQVVITGLEEDTPRSKQLGKTRARTVKDLAVQWMAKELDERAARRESTFDAGSPEESKAFLESFIRLGSRPYDGDTTHEVVIELFNLRETAEEAAGASSASRPSTPHAAPSALYQHLVDADGTITGVGFLPEHEAPALRVAAARYDLATQLGHPGARLVFAHHDHTGYTIPYPAGPATFFTTLDTTLAYLGTTWKHHDILLVTCLPDPTHTEQIRTTAQELGYQGTIHTTTSPHTEITEHHGARPLHPGDTPHPEAVILNPTNQTIRFPQGARSVVDHDAVDRLHALGTALYSPLVNAQRAGGPFPRIEITGYGNSRITAQATATGQERADSVRLRILNGMREEHESRESGTASTDPAQLAQAIVATSGGRAPSPKSLGGTLTERRRSAFVEIPPFPQAPARVPTFTYRDPHGVDSSMLGPLRFSPSFGPERLAELGFLVAEGPALAMEAPGGAMIFPSRTDLMGLDWGALRPFHGVLTIWAQPNPRGEVLLRDSTRVSYRDFATWVRDMAPGSHRVLLLSDRAGEQPGQRPDHPVRPDLSLAAILSETLGGSVLAPIDQLLSDGRTSFALRWGLFRNGELVAVHSREPIGWRHELGHTEAVRDSGLAAPSVPWHPLTATENAERAAMAEQRATMAAEAAEAYLAPPAVGPATPAAPAPSVLDAHVAPPGAAYARPPVPGAEPITLPRQVEVRFPPGPAVVRDGNRHLENLFRHVYVRALRVAANAGYDYPHVFITGLFDSPATGTAQASARAKARASELKARAAEWFTREEAARRARRQERFGPDSEISAVAEHLFRVGESRARTGGQSHDVVIEIMNTSGDDEAPLP